MQKVDLTAYLLHANPYELSLVALYTEQAFLSSSISPFTGNCRYSRAYLSILA